LNILENRMLAKQVLVEQADVTPERAERLLQLDPQLEQRLAIQIDALKQRIEADAAAAAERRFAETNEGRREAAERVRAEKAARDRLAEGARQLLINEGAPPDRVAELSTDEAIRRAGIEGERKRKPVEVRRGNHTFVTENPDNVDAELAENFERASAPSNADLWLAGEKRREAEMVEKRAMKPGDDS
jgi:hypothetical protein